MCYWKQWRTKSSGTILNSRRLARRATYREVGRNPRTKIRNLLKLGTSKRQAIRTGLSSKAYWHLARTLATQTGMTNDWLESQGLISIRDCWMKAHGYA